MVVYWDLAVLWNFALDYILLLGTARLAGASVRRARLAAGAALGAVSAVIMLPRPFSPWLLALSMLLMCLVAFGRTARSVKLTLLFMLLACALGGGVLLLGRCLGGAERLAESVLYARLPWGVFAAASGLSYLLLSVIFRGGAKHDRADFVRARIEYGGKHADVRLLRDTGNALTDPLTGEGVPVIEKSVLAPLFLKGNGGGAAYKDFTTLRVSTVSGADNALDAFRCDMLTVDGRALGARLVAVTPETFGGAYEGLWYAEEREETERHELEATVG